MTGTGYVVAKRDEEYDTLTIGDNPQEIIVGDFPMLSG